MPFARIESRKFHADRRDRMVACILLMLCILVGFLIGFRQFSTTSQPGAYQGGKQAGLFGF